MFLFRVFCFFLSVYWSHVSCSLYHQLLINKWVYLLKMRSPVFSFHGLPLPALHFVDCKQAQIPFGGVLNISWNKSRTKMCLWEFLTDFLMWDAQLMQVLSDNSSWWQYKEMYDSKRSVKENLWTESQISFLFSFTAGLEGSSTHLLSVSRRRGCSGGRANHNHGHGQSEMRVQQAPPTVCRKTGAARSSNGKSSFYSKHVCAEDLKASFWDF